jgi:hypothetical protein
MIIIHGETTGESTSFTDVKSAKDVTIKAGGWPEQLRMAADAVEKLAKDGFKSITVRTQFDDPRLDADRRNMP